MLYKEIIFNHAEGLHPLYQQDHDSSAKQLEAMSKGLLFSILVSQRKKTPSVIGISLIDKRKCILNLYNHQHSVRKAKLFLNQLKGQDNLKDFNKKIFDFYEEIQ